MYVITAMDRYTKEKQKTRLVVYQQETATDFLSALETMGFVASVQKQDELPYVCEAEGFRSDQLFDMVLAYLRALANTGEKP